MKTRIIDIAGLAIKRNGRFLLQDVSFTLDSQETLSIIGAEGAGKGLLVKALLGIQRGEVMGTIKVPPKMGLVSSAYPSIHFFTVFENLSVVARFAGVHSRSHLAEIIEDALKRVDLWSEIKAKLHETVETLSEFQKLRLELARTLLLDPSVVILDKPTASSDPEQKSHYEAIVERLKTGKSFIWINHDLEQVARVSDKILFLKEGRMVEFGSAEAIFTMPVKPETENFISRRVNV